MDAMNATITLPSGIELESPKDRLAAYYGSDNYALLYDRFFVDPDAPLSLSDILITVMINSRIRPAAAALLYLAGPPPDGVPTTLSDFVPGDIADLQPLLAAIPAGCDLTTEPEPPSLWLEVENVLKEFCKLKGVKLATATKVLHKKRPNLFPLIDKVVQAVYRTCDAELNGNWLDLKEWQRGVAIMKLIRKDLLEPPEGMTVAAITPIGELCSWLGGTEIGVSVTKVRVLDALIWYQYQATV